LEDLKCSQRSEENRQRRYLKDYYVVVNEERATPKRVAVAVGAIVEEVGGVWQSAEAGGTTIFLLGFADDARTNSHD
jgi:hypothetical protein